MRNESIPVKIMILVVTDSILDGFLLGIALSLNPISAVVLAISQSIEMFFLAVSLRNCLRSRHVASWKQSIAGVVFPCILFMSGASGYFFGAAFGDPDSPQVLNLSK